MMKKIVCLLATLLLLMSSAVAETLTIDLATATEDEVSAVLDKLQTVKIEMVKARLANETIEPDADGVITFRNVPWFTNRTKAEEIMGISSSSKYAGSLYRLSYVDYKSVHTGSDYVEGELGCNASYSNATVAGYTPSSTRICYIFPIVDGEIIRDVMLAQAYMGYYTFDEDDFGDLATIYSDLETKLNKVYGNSEYYPGKYRNYTEWKDAAGNFIRLQIDKDSTYLTLAYVAGNADARLDEMAQAYIDEKTYAEEMLRLENSNNTDGL